MATASPLHHELEESRRQHEETRDRIRALVDRVTPEQFNWRPAEGRWSIAQNIAHLTLEGGMAADRIGGLIERGRAEGVTESGPFRHGWFGRWYVWFLEPPYRAKISTSPGYVPPSEPLSFDDVVPDFMALKRRMLRQISEANGLDLGRLRDGLPFFPGWFPALSLGQWIRQAAVHERRHLWQIKGIIENPAFPGAVQPA